MVALYPDARAGCAAIERVLGSGIQPAALEYLDAGALAAAGAGGAVRRAGRRVRGDRRGRRLGGGDGGGRGGAARGARRGALALHAPQAPAEVAALWRWRDGVAIAVTAQRGGKMSEDVVVPLERLADAIEVTLEIGARHGLEACSWGHAGDGNLHATFLVDAHDAAELERASAAAAELFATAAAMGGSISGEHGLGWVKRGHLGAQWNEATLRLHRAVKHAIDPQNLMNPGKKI